MRETNTHIYFWGSFLSNFYWCPFTVLIDGEVVEFKTSEHAFMAYKARHFKDFVRFKQIILSPDGKSAKALGRKVANFNVEAWNDVSTAYMRQACGFKFQLPDLQERLLQTKNKILVEASPLDTIRGVGLHESDDRILDSQNWLGENRLGNVLMSVRSNIQNNI